MTGESGAGRFRYSARDEWGTARSGEILAESEEDARLMLAKRGLREVFLIRPEGTPANSPTKPFTRYELWLSRPELYGRIAGELATGADLATALRRGERATLGRQRTRLARAAAKLEASATPSEAICELGASREERDLVCRYGLEAALPALRSEPLTTFMVSFPGIVASQLIIAVLHGQQGPAAAYSLVLATGIAIPFVIEKRARKCLSSFSPDDPQEWHHVRGRANSQAVLSLILLMLMFVVITCWSVYEGRSRPRRTQSPTDLRNTRATGAGSEVRRIPSTPR